MKRMVLQPSSTAYFQYAPNYSSRHRFNGTDRRHDGSATAAEIGQQQRCTPDPHAKMVAMVPHWPGLLQPLANGWFDADGTYPPEYFQSYKAAVKRTRALSSIAHGWCQNEMPPCAASATLSSPICQLISAAHHRFASSMRIFRKNDLARLIHCPMADVTRKYGHCTKK